MDLDVQGSVGHEPLVLLDAKTKGRPWTRFWARMLDYMIFGFVIGIIAALLNIPMPLDQQPFMGMIIIFLWVFVESLLLCTWGTTPGKWLLRSVVRTNEGQKLTLLQSLNRSFGVWWMGVGAGIPIVNLVTMIIASVKLSNHQITTWDRTGHFQVEHQPIGAVRVVLVVLIYLFFVLFVYGGLNG